MGGIQRAVSRRRGVVSSELYRCPRLLLKTLAVIPTFTGSK